MSLLRIALPALHDLTLHSELHYARLERDGRVSETGSSTLQLLGQGTGSLSTECFLHPSDSLMTSIELPPLPAARIRAAVLCAAQALMLDNSAQMHLAHSPRGAEGLVHLGWLPRVDLERLGRLLIQSGLKLRALYQAPYALPVPPAGQLSVCLLDEHLLVRHASGQASVHPAPQESLDHLLANGSSLRWIGAQAPEAVAVAEHLPAHQRWSGTPPTWGMHGAVTAPVAVTHGWGRALACCAMAIAVWVIGLNIYAAREADQGQQLKAQMSQRVKQVFPELPVILNPLQQARQQLAARHNGSAEDSEKGFSSLLLQAGNAMPFMVGSVEQLSFSAGQLQVQLLADIPPAAADGNWQAALREAGLVALRTDHGWTLSASGERMDDDESSQGGDDE